MNLPTILVSLAIAAALVAIIVHQVRARRKGCSGCSCGCGGCDHTGCGPK